MILSNLFVLFLILFISQLDYLKGEDDEYYQYDNDKIGDDDYTDLISPFGPTDASNNDSILPIHDENNNSPPITTTITTVIEASSPSLSCYDLLSVICPTQSVTGLNFQESLQCILVSCHYALFFTVYK